MKILSCVIAVLVIAVSVQAMPMLTKALGYARDTTLAVVWLNSGAGVETRLGDLRDPIVVFEPVLMVEPIGLRCYWPSAPIKYAQFSTLVTANNTGTLPHGGFALHAGPYFAAGMTWGDCPPHFYLSSEELVKTLFNWIGKGAKAVVKKI